MEFVGLNKLSLLDFPSKTAAILFTNGCNFRCPFCHNGLTLLYTAPTPIDFNDILSFLRKRVGILDGVVISGGEPTLMPDLKEKIKAIKELGYSVKLDTNGTNPNVVKDLIDNKLIDYVAMDIKNSLNKYSLTTGTNSLNLDNIVKTIFILQNSNIDYEFRTTLIEEFHNENDISEMAILLKGSKKLFLQKFKISDGVINKNLHPVNEDLANKFVKILSATIDHVELRGY